MKKKYKLLKNLPWMKAGTIFEVEEKGLYYNNVHHWSECDNGFKSYYFDFDDATDETIVEDGWIGLANESECEHDGEIKSYICQKCGEDVRDSNKIEKLEISNNAVRDSFNYIMRETHEKINEIIDHLEAENEIDKIWDEIKDIKAVMRNHHIGHPSNGGSMGGDMCRAYGTNGEERGRK